MNVAHAVLFDLDGTLVDSLPDLHDATNELLARHRRPAIDREQARLAVGHGAKALIARIWQETGEPATEAELAAMHQEFLAIYRPIATRRTRPYPGVHEVLEALAGAGYPLGVVTNKPEDPTHDILRHLDLARWFGAVVGGDTTPEKKPHPAPVVEAMRRLSVDRATLVGDSRADVGAARAAGIGVIGVSWGYDRGRLDADHVIDHLSELPHILRNPADQRLT